MPTSPSVRIVSILIIITTLVGFGVAGVIGLTGARTAMSINVGNVNSQVNGASESISVPVSLRNPGPLSLNGINVVITILDVNGTALSTGGGGPLSLAAGASGQLPISILFDLSHVQQSTLRTLATNNENLTLRASLEASVSTLTSMSAVIDTAYKWGAPVSNLRLGAISASSYNSTAVKISLQLSFTDTSQNFGVSGTVSGTILGQSGNIVGTINLLNVNVVAQSSFADQLTGFINQSAETQKSVTFHLVFQTTFGTFT